MLQFIQFYLILFICFFINTDSRKSINTNECLTFTNTKQPITSSCKIPDKRSKKEKCLTCNINEINNITANHCWETFTCANLKFPNDAIFKNMLKEYHEIIYKLFKKVKSKNKFNISLEIFNSGKIDKKYIESILGKGDKPYYSLNILVLKRNTKQPLPKIDDNLSTVSISQFYIHIACNNGGGMIRYNVTNRSVNSKEDKTCQNSSTTPSTSSAKLDQITRTSTKKQEASSVVTTTQPRSTSQSTLSTEQVAKIQPDTTMKNDITTVTNRNEISTTTTSLHQTTDHTTSFSVSTTIVELKTEATKPEFITSEIKTEHTTTTAPIKTEYVPTNNLKTSDVHTSTLKITIISHTNTTLRSSTLSTESSKRFNKLLLLLLIPGLLILLTFISLIITYIFLRNRRIPDDIVIETSSNISPRSNSDASSTKISNTPSVVSSSNISTTYLSPTVLRRNRPAPASDVKRYVGHAFDTEF